MKSRAKAATLFSCLLATMVGLGCDKGKGPDPAPGSATSAEVSKPAAPRYVTVGAGNTEIVFGLGLGDKVVGVDTSSLFPEEATKRTKVGYQRALAAEGILSLTPTLVIVGAEAGPPGVLDQLKASKVRIETIDSEPTIEGTRSRIAKLATLLGADPKPMLDKLDQDLKAADVLTKKAKSKPKVLALYARGAGSAQAFGQKNAADTLVTLAGGENVMKGFEGSKPITAESLAAADPDLVLVSTRGLESLGGPDALFSLPGLAMTKAGKKKAFVAIDDLLLFGLGPRAGEGVMTLSKKLHPELVSP